MALFHDLTRPSFGDTLCLVMSNVCHGAMETRYLRMSRGAHPHSTYKFDGNNLRTLFVTRLAASCNYGPKAPPLAMRFSRDGLMG